MSKCPFDFTRRNFLALAGGVAAVAGAAGFGAGRLLGTEKKEQGAADAGREPFWGTHQAGIITPAQNHTYFAAFDLITANKDDVVKLLQSWTRASARMADGEPADAIVPSNAGGNAGDSHDGGDALGLPPARLTLTFGFGAGLFSKDGKDRYGIAAKRPEAFVDLPKFSGDQLVAARSDGDLCVQACADDPQVAFHAVRQLVRLATGIAQIRWAQAGFIATPPDGGTPRNLMGFKDGTGNPDVQDHAAMDQFVWVGAEAPEWMRGGSYVVARRARVALEHWDNTPVAFQEQTFGRQKISGAPLGMPHENDALNLDAVDKDGNFIIPENAHVRLATAASNGGIKILRRSYSYNDGVSLTAERWPPWHQGMEYDAGLLFICYQRDPRTGFIKLFDKMAKFDMMNQFVTHVGGGLFACPGGTSKDGFIGQKLFA